MGPGSAIGVAMDVTSEEQVNSGVAEVVKHWGRVDVLVSNAGIQIVHPVESFPFADWKNAGDPPGWCFPDHPGLSAAYV